MMQGKRWLRRGSRTCGLELLPLPSPNVGVWHYDKFSDDPILRNRASYRAAMLPTRITAIKTAINEHKPRNMVFYSKQYQAYWKQIASPDFVEGDGFQIAQSGNTSFICTLHPTALIKGAGKKLAYWESIGARLAGDK
jgi:hypothetical protein